ncbi:MAG: GlsB/YeaQ/YmgE family stress response membrane protein [Spirochaetota bacterium]
MPKGAWIGRLILGIFVGAGILFLLGIAFLAILPALLVAITALLIYHFIKRKKAGIKSGRKKPSQEILLRTDQYHTESDEEGDQSLSNE